MLLHALTPAAPPRAVVRALVAAHRVLWLVERHGRRRALASLTRAAPALVTSEQIALADAIVRAIYIFLRVRSPRSLGRPAVRALAVCAGLRAIGLDARIVIGRREITSRGLPLFTSWVTLGGETVSELVSEVVGYAELSHWPPGGPDASASQS